MKKWAHQQTGFTIVELLIVVVVIAILAVITIVSYNGITERAKFSTMRSDLASINKAILLYYADNGSYPITPASSSTCASGGWCGWEQATGDGFVPGLSPKYMNQIPQLPTSNAYGDTYLYRSTTGTDYKLIRYQASYLSASESAAMADLMTTDCTAGTNTSRWGYWNSNVSKCW